MTCYLQLGPQCKVWYDMRVSMAVDQLPNSVVGSDFRKVLSNERACVGRDTRVCAVLDVTVAL